MNWKKKLKTLEYAKQWDEAIIFMQQIIKENSQDMDAYIFINFLLMNLLVEEDHDESKHTYYETLAKWYFDESYAKFSDNAEYLYITAKTAVMSPWYFGIDIKEYEKMIEKAKQLDPDNLAYKENYYWNLSEKNPLDPELIAYAKLILSKNSSVRQQLQEKGMVGQYLLGMKESWCEGVLITAQKLQNLDALSNWLRENLFQKIKKSQYNLSQISNKPH